MCNQIYIFIIIVIITIVIISVIIVIIIIFIILNSQQFSWFSEFGPLTKHFLFINVLKTF